MATTGPGGYRSSRYYVRVAANVGDGMGDGGWSREHIETSVGERRLWLLLFVVVADDGW
jgi:hypothetical protein